MNQKEFSERILELLKETYPEFIPSVQFKDDESFDCELKSPSREFAMWIATYNQEISFGLETPDGKSDIHTHISCYDEEDIEDCFAALKGMIEEIRSNSVIVYRDSANVYDWIKKDELEQKEKKTRTSFQKLVWSS